MVEKITHIVVAFYEVFGEDIKYEREFDNHAKLEEHIEALKKDIAIKKYEVKEIQKKR